MSRALTSEVKPLLKLGLPVAMSFLANMTLQMVDTAFVGHLGAEALGGVSVANSIFTTFLVLGIGLLLGADYLISHAFGAGKINECHRLFVQVIYLATLACI